MPKAVSDPKVIQKLDRKRQVLTMLRQGFDIREISEQVGLDETYIRTLSREEMQYLDLVTQEMQQHFVGLTFARSEWLMSKVLPILDKMEMPLRVDYEKGEDYDTALSRYLRVVGDILRHYVTLARLQKDVLQVKGVGEKKDNGVTVEQMVNNITITAESDFYREALDRMQTSMFGETFAEMQSRYLPEADVIQIPDDRLDKIEEAINKLNVPNDTPESTDDE